MSRVESVGMCAVLALGCAVGGWAQGMRGGMGQRTPQMYGAFKPAPGSGAQYVMTAKDRTMDFAYAIVGQEDVEGKTGYWMEIRTEGAGAPGETVMKELVIVEGDNPQIKRMIMQTAGRPPMEMPVGMMMGMGQHAKAAEQGDKSMGEKIGTETITVPAGTYECEHYRKQGKSGPVDYWVSAKVSPYGMVKMTSPDATMELKKILSNETSHIKGEPQKMDFQMPHF